MITPRSLRRARPGAYRAGAAVAAAAIGASTAAWGVFQVVEPYAGNGARSDARGAEQPAPSPGDTLLDAIVNVVSQVPPPLETGTPSWLSGLDPLAPGSLVITVLGPGGQIGTAPSGPGDGDGGPHVVPPVPPPSLGSLVSGVGGGDGKDTDTPGGGIADPTGPDGLVCSAPITAPVTGTTPQPLAAPAAQAEGAVEEATGCPAPDADASTEQPGEVEQQDDTPDRGAAFGTMA